MNEEILNAKEILLKEQLKIVQLEKKKITDIKAQNYESARNIQDRIIEAKHHLHETIIPHLRLFIEQHSQELELNELIFTLAPLENKFRKIILEKEFLDKNKLLKNEKPFEISEPVTRTEQIRQKNQLLQMFIQMELLFRKWTEYYQFQKENITALFYTNLVKQKHLALDLYPELQSVHCFYGSFNAIVGQLKEQFSNRSSTFNPILIILVQYGTQDGVEVPQEQQSFIKELLDQYFTGVVKYHDGKMKNLGNMDEMMLYVTIKQDYSPLNVVGVF